MFILSVLKLATALAIRPSELKANITQ